MSFKITVEETRTSTRMQRGSWVALEKNDQGKEIMGYAPDRENEFTTEETVYIQVVESLILSPSSTR